MLHGTKAIAEYLACTPKRVRSLARRYGAPVRVTGRGQGRRYMARTETLDRWVDGEIVTRRK